MAELIIMAGLNAYKPATSKDVENFVCFLRKINITAVVAMSKKLGNNFIK